MDDEADNHEFGSRVPQDAHAASHKAISSDNPLRTNFQQPVAIVGMSCRLPGNVNSPAEFWELCSRARSGFMSGAPKERFSHEAFYDPNPGKTGAYHSQGGYFLGEDPALFDAPFFSLTEKEAIASKYKLLA